MDNKRGDVRGLEEDRTRQLQSAANNILLLINSSLDTHEIMQRVIVEAANALGCESARIALRQNGRWVMTYQHQMPEDLTGQFFTDEELPHAALAMATRLPVAIDDAFNDHRTNVEVMRSYGIRSVLVLPLMEKTAVIGTLFFNYHSAPISFSPVEIEYAETIAAGTAVALQNARLYQDLKKLQEDLEERNRLSQTLNAVDRTIYSTLDTSEIFEKVLQLAAEAIGAHSAMVFSKEAQGWVVRHVHQLSRSLLGRPFSDEEVKHTATTAVTKEPLAVADAYLDDRVNNDFARQHQIRSLLAFPLMLKGEVIGDLVFHYHARSAGFTENEIDFVRKLQTSLSLALQNVDLFDRLKKQSEVQRITERDLKQTSEQKEAGAAQLEAIVNSMNDALVIADAQGHVLRMNPASLRLHGFATMEEAQRKLPAYYEIFDILDLDGTPLAVEDIPLARALAGETLTNYEIRVRRRDTGVEFIGNYSGAPVRDAAGNITAALITIRDVTELKGKEEALKKSEERIRGILESTTDGFVSLDHDWRFTYINRTGESLINMTTADVIGRYLWDIFPASSESLRKVEKGESVHLEEYYPAPLNMYVELHCYPTADGPTIFFRNITERKQYEERLRQTNAELEQRVAERTEKLVRAIKNLQAETEERVRTVEELREKDRLLVQQARLAALGEMIGNIAHQWRQPLNSIALIVQELGVYFEEGAFSQEYLDQSVAEIMKLIQHMSQTITDFRNFFKPDKSKVRFVMNKVISTALTLAQPAFKEIDAAFDVELGEETVVEGYPTEFSQVLLNILMNARDVFRERNVASPRVEVRLATNAERHAVLTISDNGGGIPEEILDRIFDPYFTTKSDEKGTGIGLYMSKMIIESNMQGTLKARNTGSGAEFTIELCCDLALEGAPSQ